MTNVVPGAVRSIAGAVRAASWVRTSAVEVTTERPTEKLLLSAPDRPLSGMWNTRVLPVTEAYQPAGRMVASAAQPRLANWRNSRVVPSVGPLAGPFR